MNPVEAISTSRAVGEIVRALSARKRVVASGAFGSLATIIAAATATKLSRPVLLVVAHADESDTARDEAQSCGVEAFSIPALESLPGDSGVDMELFARRLGALRRLLSGEGGAFVAVASIQSLMQAAPARNRLPDLHRVVRKGEHGSLRVLIDWLASVGYERNQSIEEPGQFSLRGGILDVFPAAGAPVRIDFFGDDVDRISAIDAESLGSLEDVEQAEFAPAEATHAALSDDGESVLDYVPSDCVVACAEMFEIAEQGRGYFERVTDPRGVARPHEVIARLQRGFHAFAELNRFSATTVSADVAISLPAESVPVFPHDASEAMDVLGRMGEHTPCFVASDNAAELQRFCELLAAREDSEARAITPVHQYVHAGFIWSQDEARFALIAHHEIFHRAFIRRRKRNLGTAKAMDTFLDFAPGDYVVHADHGIARFTGLEMMTPGHLKAGERNVPRSLASRGPSRDDPAEQEEYLVLEFAGRSTLHVPCLQIDLVQKYVGGFKGKPPLSQLGGQKWKNQKQRVYDSVKSLASELLRLRAAREALPGIAYPADTAWQREFEAEFPYDETDDQLNSLAFIKSDMHAERPMDRLVCGDVGFGKTELAIRAAFKACEYGKQVAVLVPTKVLAEQHERTFRARFADYPFRIESLSRMKSGAEISDTLDKVRKGQVDIAIGTHRLLSKDVRFKDLGLIVVDEEQRFGVEHKEALLRARLTADVLTLSATPIPRTLHMSMLGLRDISSLTTPPVDRQAVVTEVIPHDRDCVRTAIQRELTREGQVFYVHNRVYDIVGVADDIRAMAPGARVVVGHGQMAPDELEEVMLTFIRGEADILVSTTIIESGIDIPNANTMIIDDAHRFGLADLHQLRGRVGRSSRRAYCYLLLPRERAMGETAKKRLKAVEQYSMLGAGFKIAMRDLEIRGAGNLLGAEQSGHIAAVGYDMYCRLLDRAVHELKLDQPIEPSRTHVEIGLICVIPRTYIPSDMRRLEAYRRFARATTPADLEVLERDLAGAYGKVPKSVDRLFMLARLRVAAGTLGVRSIAVRGQDVVLTPRGESPGRSATDSLGGEKEIAERVARRLDGARGRVSVITPRASNESFVVYYRPPDEYLRPDTLARTLVKRFEGARPEPEPRPRAAVTRTTL